MRISSQQSAIWDLILPIDGIFDLLGMEVWRTMQRV